jgi:hypothetical protein
MPEQIVADVELDSQVHVNRRPALLNLLEALKKWPEAGGYIR